MIGDWVLVIGVRVFRVFRGPLPPLVPRTSSLRRVGFRVFRVFGGPRLSPCSPCSLWSSEDRLKAGLRANARLTCSSGVIRALPPLQGWAGGFATFPGRCPGLSYLGLSGLQSRATRHTGSAVLMPSTRHDSAPYPRSSAFICGSILQVPGSGLQVPGSWGLTSVPGLRLPPLCFLCPPLLPLR